MVGEIYEWLCEVGHDLTLTTTALDQQKNHHQPLNIGKNNNNNNNK